MGLNIDDPKDLEKLRGTLITLAMVSAKVSFHDGLDYKAAFDRALHCITCMSNLLGVTRSEVLEEIFQKALYGAIEETYTVKLKFSNNGHKRQFRLNGQNSKRLDN